jgi:hypothetical protein
MTPWRPPTDPIWITANKIVQGLGPIMASIDELTTATTNLMTALTGVSNVIAQDQARIAALEAAQAGLIQPAALDPIVANINTVTTALTAVVPAP